ncbi:MAG: S41 family peptidase [Candidatus Bipolaricaulota bacterium]
MKRCVLLLVVVLGLSSPVALPAEDPFALVDEVYQLILNYYYRAEEVESEDLVHGALRGMIEALDDPYSELLTAEEFEQWQRSLHGEFTGVGIEIGIRDDKLTVISPLPETPAERAGLRPGDVIVKVDGEPIDGWRMDEISSAIRGEEGTEVTLTLERADGDLEDVVLERATIRLDPVRVELLDEAPAAHVRIFRMSDDTSEELGNALADLPLEELDGIVLDLRRNPGGYLRAAVESSAHFLEYGKTVLTTVGPAYGERIYRSRGGVMPDVPLVVLVDEGTASAAEILAGALQDHEAAVLIGRPTFGKGIIQELVAEFPDGSVIKLTTQQYFTPDGHPVHDRGIMPDIEVEWDPQDADPDEDLDLEAALKWIRSNSASLVGAP